MGKAPEAKKNNQKIKIQVTVGNIRNGHVYLRDHLWFFPKSAMRAERGAESTAERCVLELSDVGEIESDIDAEKGIFRWRGWKKFFHQHHVSAGDHIVFSKRNRHRFAVSVEHNVLDGVADTLPAPPRSGVAYKGRARPPHRGNDLSGDEWLRCSLSIWSDIRKTGDEMALAHPAMFPAALCERLITMFLRRRGTHRIVDPFMGSGATLLAARNLGKIGIGIEISERYVRMAHERLSEPKLFRESAPPYQIHQDDARNIARILRPQSIDLCITSPPYWNILNQKRTADYKARRNYGNLTSDLSTISDYDSFLTELGAIFAKVYEVMRPGAYCVVIVMDLRKKNRFFSFHSDLAGKLIDVGFEYDDLIIWDRGHEYNNLRPLGYPSVFRVNKIHEFLLILRRPGAPTRHG